LSEQGSAVRSRDEIESAIRAFSDADWARLRKVARRYAFDRPIDPEDLLQEALLRSLSSRRCPTDVDVVKFLAEAMRSIAHGEAEKADSRPALVASAGSDDMQRAVLTYPDSSSNTEDTVIERQNATEIRRGILALFDDDAVAHVIVEGIMEGMPAEELRDLTGLDQTAYASKRKLIRRRVDKAYPKGWTL